MEMKIYNEYIALKDWYETKYEELLNLYRAKSKDMMEEVEKRKDHFMMTGIKDYEELNIDYRIEMIQTEAKLEAWYQEQMLEILGPSQTRIDSLLITIAKDKKDESIFQSSEATKYIYSKVSERDKAFLKYMRATNNYIKHRHDEKTLEKLKDTFATFNELRGDLYYDSGFPILLESVFSTFYDVKKLKELADKIEEQKDVEDPLGLTLYK